MIAYSLGADQSMWLSLVYVDRFERCEFASSRLDRAPQDIDDGANGGRMILGVG
jgi:hypothetical protein